jgi:hypothetical protein
VEFWGGASSATIKFTPHHAGSNTHCALRLLISTLRASLDWPRTVKELKAIKAVRIVDFIDLGFSQNYSNSSLIKLYFCIFFTVRRKNGFTTPTRST